MSDERTEEQEDWKENWERIKQGKDGRTKQEN